MSRNLKGFLILLGVYLLVSMTHFIADVNGFDVTLVWIIETIILIVATIVYFANKYKRFNKFAYPISVTIIVAFAMGIFQDSLGFGILIIGYGVVILIPILFIIGWIVDTKQNRIK